MGVNSRLTPVSGVSPFDSRLPCFSVVFVEPGQSAARAGLRSGDYVVRMGAENVVLMDQAAGLELLQ